MTDEDVDNLLLGLRLDVADLRDLAKDADAIPHLRKNIGHIFQCHADLVRIVNEISPYREAAE